MNTISNLTASDLAQAYLLEKICHPIPWSEKTFFSNQGERYLNTQTSLQDRIVGFLICQTVADEATLFNIAIHPDFRKQGLAKALLSKLIEELTALNITTLWLEVRASNMSAIKLYQSLGFNEITIRKNYYPTVTGQQEDAIVMACMLNF